MTWLHRSGGMLWSPLVMLAALGTLLFTLTSCQGRQNSVRPNHDDPQITTASSASSQETPRSEDPSIQLVQATEAVPVAPTKGLSDPVGLKVSIVAWVNGKPIFRDELLNMAAAGLFDAEKLPEPARSAERTKILKQQLKELIDREVVLQDAYAKLAKQKVFLEKLREHSNKAFERWMRKRREETGLNEIQFSEMLRRQGWTVESMRRKFERDLIFEQYLRTRVQHFTDQVGHQEIRDYYDSHLNEFQTVDRVKWQNIFLAVGSKYPTLDQARQAAQQILARCRAGEDFGKFLSLDEGGSYSYRQGYGLGERRGEIQPREIEPHLWQMRDGELGPPIEISTGVHLFRLVKRDYAGQLSFSETVQSQIRHKLREEIFRVESRRIVRELYDKAVVEIDSEALK